MILLNPYEVKIKIAITNLAFSIRSRTQSIDKYRAQAAEAESKADAITQTLQLVSPDLKRELTDLQVMHTKQARMWRESLIPREELLLKHDTEYTRYIQNNLCPHLVTTPSTIDNYSTCTLCTLTIPTP